MNKIIPFLWFDNQAEEAVAFYTFIFKNSKILHVSKYGKSGAEVSGRQDGSIMTVEFKIMGQKFTALNGGPVFNFTPAVSFLVACESKEEADFLWENLSEGGKVLMEFGEYPFSEKYGWIQDKYGLSWQIMFMGEREIKDKIIPTLLFVGEQSGKAEEAIIFYASVFHNSDVGDISRYSEGEEPDKEGIIKHAAFKLEGKEFAAMDSAHEHKFGFNEANSFLVTCESQEEIDYYWARLSADPKAEQCGWLKDKYGVSWQIVPSVLGEMLSDTTKSENVMKSMLKMKKIDINELKQAYAG